MDKWIERILGGRLSELWETAFLRHEILRFAQDDSYSTQDNKSVVFRLLRYKLIVFRIGQADRKDMAL